MNSEFLVTSILYFFIGPTRNFSKWLEMVVLVDQIFLFSESDVIQTASFYSMQFMMAVQRGRTEGIFRLASDCCTAEFFSDF